MGWIVGMSLLASRLAAESPIELPGCTAPSQVVAAYRLPSELGRSCGSDAACWRAGLDRAGRLAGEFPTSYDAHRVRILVARAAARVLGPEVVDEVAADYRRLAAAMPTHAAYPHLLAQLRLEGEAYEAELERLAAEHPDSPWVQLSIAYLFRTDSSEALRARATTALERFVTICPARYEAALPVLERLNEPGTALRLAPALRAPAVDRGDYEASARLWVLEARALDSTGDASARFAATVRQEIDRLTRAGLPSGLEELEALRIGYELVGDAAGVAAVDAEIVAVHPCSMPARRVRSLRLEPMLQDAAWLDLESRRATAHRVLAASEPASHCVGDDSARRLRIRALAALGAEASTQLAAALDEWLAAPGSSEPEPELWAAERWIEAGAGYEHLANLLERARARRSKSDGAPPAAGTRELAIAAEAATTLGPETEAKVAVERLRRALDETGTAVGSDPARAALDRLEAAASCAASPGAAALARFGELLAREPEGSPVERAALRCWTATHGSADGFASWRREVSRVEVTRGAWRTVDEEIPPVALTDLAGEPIDWAGYAGKTVLVRAWAGWCGPCRQELPALATLAGRFAGRTDLAILLASVEENPSSLVELVARDALPVDAAFGGAELLDSGALARVPAAWIISPSGRVVRRQEGPAGEDAAVWIEAAADALAEVAGPDPSLGPVAAP
jgi:thiol-disulfide isomerase/thioredoxin